MHECTRGISVLEPHLPPAYHCKMARKCRSKRLPHSTRRLRAQGETTHTVFKLPHTVF